ncbi:MAG: hypothetical protein WD733_05170 [Bryobacterales bacterium]
MRPSTRLLHCGDEILTTGSWESLLENSISYREINELVGNSLPMARPWSVPGASRGER